MKYYTLFVRLLKLELKQVISEKIRPGSMIETFVPKIWTSRRKESPRASAKEKTNTHTKTEYVFWDHFKF